MRFWETSCFYLMVVMLIYRATKEFYEIPYDEIVDRIKKQQEQVSKKSESDLRLKSISNYMKEK